MSERARMGIQCMMCKLVSFTVSTVPAYSGSFHPAAEEQWPIPATPKHIFWFSRVICWCCVSASVFTASLPSPSRQTLLHLSCRPQRRAELTQSNLQKGKRAHRCASPPRPPPLLLRPSWHLVKEKLCHVGLGAERENRGTPESRLNSECKAFCGDFAPVLQAGSSQWVLQWQMAASHPLINTPLCSKSGFRVTNNNNCCKVAGDLQST